MFRKVDSEAVISELGGTCAVAKALGYTVARVSNWKTRGIPARELFERWDVFRHSQSACWQLGLPTDPSMHQVPSAVQESTGNHECASVQ